MFVLSIFFIPVKWMQTIMSLGAPVKIDLDFSLTPCSQVHFKRAIPCSVSRWETCGAAGPEVTSRLWEQQHGSQYWQHTEHAMLQQQHSVVQDVLVLKSSGQTLGFTVTGLFFKNHESEKVNTCY